MVRIAVAGGSGQVAQEVIDALVATKKHEIIIVTRNASTTTTQPGVSTRTVDYNDKGSLVHALQGTHTVLSFVQLLSDPGNKSQKNLIDAAIAAGVKRFAPSEWSSADFQDMPWWTGKGQIREYLKEVNANGKVLEYSLFQPGLFLDYLAFPHKTTKYIDPLNTMFDFQNRRAIVVEGCDFFISFTAARDLAAVVARAVEYEGEWPEIGGIRGNRVSVSQVLEIGARVRGRPFTIDTVKLEDLEAGHLKTSWALETAHKSVAPEQAAEMLKGVLIGFLVSGAKGAWDVSDGFNRILLDHQFMGIEDFLKEVWFDKS